MGSALKIAAPQTGDCWIVSTPERKEPFIFSSLSYPTSAVVRISTPSPKSEMEPGALPTLLGSDGQKSQPEMGNK